MNKNKILTIVIVLLLLVILLTIVRYLSNQNGLLINPGVKKATGQSTVQPSTPAYNPPKEVKYDGSTDLQKELDSIEPQVLDSDFQD
ncbi:hypothetical protein HYU45_04600 [Candidatus Daviesbacteria bacterium]|nr:hypothetical protein [Candidatus Daviesbacteria bacterium]